MGVAIYRLDESGEKVRVRNVKRKSESETIRVQKLVANISIEDEFCTFFDGDGDYGVIPNGPLMSWTGSGSIEAMAWRKYGNSEQGFLVSKGTDVPGIDGWGLLIEVHNDYVTAGCVVKQGSYQQGYYATHYMNTLEKWITAKCNYISGNCVQLLVNGILVASTPVPTGALRHANDSMIAQVPNIYSDCYYGAIKHVKFRNGETLINHYPMDDDPETGVFRDIVSGIDAVRNGNPTRIKIVSSVKINL